MKSDYQLRAVIVHQGTLSCGHYLTYVKKGFPVQEWFRFDDDVVELIPPSEMEQLESAYVLIYEKIWF